MHSFCGESDCTSILTRLANTVRAKLAYDELPGFRDAVFAAKYGLLDFEEAAEFAVRGGLTQGVFAAFVESNGYDELARTKFIWPELRRLIFERDQGCVRCRGGYQQVRHIVPIPEGGETLEPCNLEAACMDCNVSSLPRKPREKSLSTLRGVVGEAVGKTLFYSVLERSPTDTTPQRGHPPNRHELFNRWIVIRGLLAGFLHEDPKACQGADKWKRVEMVMAGLRLQATRGKCFASASYLAGVGGGHRKTWDRSLARLRSLDLVQTERLVRQDNSQSTNLTDFSLLWTLLLKLLARPYHVAESVGEDVWVKLKGMWLPLAEALQWEMADAEPSARAPRRRF